VKLWHLIQISILRDDSNWKWRSCLKISHHCPAINNAYTCRIELQMVLQSFRAATNMEYSEISLKMKTKGIIREFCAVSGKNCKKQNILVRHSNICVKLFWTYLNSLVPSYMVRVWEWPVCWRLYGMTLDEGQYYYYLLFVMLTWKSKFMAMELGEFFPYLVATVFADFLSL